MGRYAEPAAARVARSVINDLSGERAVTRAGLRWELDMRHNLDRRLYAIGSYEAATVRAARACLARGDTILDIGANIGTFSLPLARAGFDVVAVEPASDTVQRLHRHIEMNSLGGKVSVAHLALGSTEGTVQLRSGTSADVGLRTTMGEGGVVECVVVRRGDQLVEDLGIRPALIKIDVEGGEFDVARSLAATLRSTKAVIVEVVEAHQSRAATSANELVQFLTAMGFEGFAIRSRGTQPWNGEQGNVLFVRFV